MADMMVKIRHKSCSPRSTQARHFVCYEEVHYGICVDRLVMSGEGMAPRGRVRGVALVRE